MINQDNNKYYVHVNTNAYLIRFCFTPCVISLQIKCTCRLNQLRGGGKNEKKKTRQMWIKETNPRDSPEKYDEPLLPHVMFAGRVQNLTYTSPIYQRDEKDRRMAHGEERQRDATRG